MLVIATAVTFVTSEWLVELSGLSAKSIKNGQNPRLDEYSSAVLACSGGCGPSNNSIEYIVRWRGLEWLGMDQYNCPELRE